MIFFKQRRLCIGVLSIILFYLLWDRMTWQPWLYMCVLMLIALSLHKNNRTDHTMLLNYFRLLIIGIYFWSGIHKLNPYFFDTIFPAVSARINLYFEDFAPFVKLIFAKGIPIIEIAIAIGLWNMKARKIAFYSAVFMHVFILIYLSPLGINYNTIVYPWNVAMIIFLFLLFYKVEESITLKFENRKWKFISFLMLVLVWVMPIFNFMGKWDHYLSFSLYSGKVSHLYVIAKKDIIREMQLEQFMNGDHKLLRKAMNIDKNLEILSINHWAIKEMNVALIPESDVYNSIIEKLKSKISLESDIHFVIYSKGSYFDYNPKVSK